MTRKDYKLIAEALRLSSPLDTSPRSADRRFQHRIDCTSIASVLARDNPRFDYIKFMAACDYTAGRD